MIYTHPIDFGIQTPFSTYRTTPHHLFTHSRRPILNICREFAGLGADLGVMSTGQLFVLGRGVCPDAPDKRVAPCALLSNFDDHAAIGVSGLIKLCTERYVLLTHSRVAILEGTTLRDVATVPHPAEAKSAGTKDPYEDSFRDLYQRLQNSKASVVDMSFGQDYWVALTSDGRIFTYGRNDVGQLGLGHTRPLMEEAPGQVQEVTAVWKLAEGERPVQVATGFKHTLALTSEGLVYGWGSNTFAQLGWTKHEAENKPVLPVLKPRLVYSLSQTLTERNAKRRIASAGKDSSTLPDSSSLMETQTQMAINYIAAAGNASAALTQQGEIFLWGCGPASGLLTVPHYLDSTLRQSVQGIVKSLALGDHHLLAIVEHLGADGKSTQRRVACFGLNSKGQLGTEYDSDAHHALRLQDLTSTTDASDTPETVVAGPSSSAIVERSGKVCVFGSNVNEKLGVSSDTTDSDVVRTLTEVTWSHRCSSEPLLGSRVAIGKTTSLLFNEAKITHTEPCVLDIRGGYAVKLRGAGFPQPNARKTTGATTGQCNRSVVKVRIALSAAHASTRAVTPGAPTFHVLDCEGELREDEDSVVIESFPPIPQSLLRARPKDESLGFNVVTVLPPLYISVAFDQAGDSFTEPLVVELFSHPGHAYLAEFERPQNQKILASLSPDTYAVYGKSSSSNKANLQPYSQRVELIPEASFFNKHTQASMKHAIHTLMPTNVPCSGGVRVRLQVMHHFAHYPDVWVRLRQLPSGRCLYPIPAEYDADEGCFYFTAPDVTADFDNALLEAAYGANASASIRALAASLNFLTPEQAGPILRSVYEAGLGESRMLTCLMMTPPRELARAISTDQASVKISLLSRADLLNLWTLAVHRLAERKGLLYSSGAAGEKPQAAKSSLPTQITYAIELSLDGGSTYSIVPAPHIAATYSGEFIARASSPTEHGEESDADEEYLIPELASSEPARDRRFKESKAKYVAVKNGSVVAPLSLTFFRVLPIRIAKPGEPVYLDSPIGTLIGSDIDSDAKDRLVSSQPAGGEKKAMIQALLNAVVADQVRWRPIPAPYLPLVSASASAANDARTLLDISLAPRSDPTPMSQSAFYALRSRITTLPMSGGRVVIDLAGAHPCFPLVSKAKTVESTKGFKVFVVFHPRTGLQPQTTGRVLDYDLAVSAEVVRPLREPRPVSEVLEAAAQLAISNGADAIATVQQIVSKVTQSRDQNVIVPSLRPANTLEPWISAILEHDSLTVPSILPSPTALDHPESPSNGAMTSEVGRVPGSPQKGRLRIIANVPSLSSVGASAPGTPQRLIDVYVAIITVEEIVSAPPHLRSELIKLYTSAPGELVHLPRAILKSALPTFMSICPAQPAFALAEPSAITVSALTMSPRISLVGCDLYRSSTSSAILKLVHQPLLSLNLGTSSGASLPFLAAVYDRKLFPFLPPLGMGQAALQRLGLALGGEVDISILAALFPSLLNSPWFTELLTSYKHKADSAQSASQLVRSRIQGHTAALTFDVPGSVQAHEEASNEGSTPLPEQSTSLSCDLKLVGNLSESLYANVSKVRCIIDRNALMQTAVELTAQQDSGMTFASAGVAAASPVGSGKSIPGAMPKQNNAGSTGPPTARVASAGGNSTSATFASTGATTAGSSNASTSSARGTAPKSTSATHATALAPTSSGAGHPEQALLSMLDGGDQETTLLKSHVDAVGTDSIERDTKSIKAPLPGHYRVVGALDPEEVSAPELGVLLTVSPQPQFISAAPDAVSALGQTLVAIRGRGFVPSPKAAVRLRLILPAPGTDAISEFLSVEKEREREVQKEKEKPVKETRGRRLQSSGTGGAGSSTAPSTLASSAAAPGVPEISADLDAKPSSGGDALSTSELVQASVAAAQAADPIKATLYPALLQAQEIPSIVIPCSWRGVLPAHMTQPTALEGSSLWPSVASVATATASSVIEATTKHFASVIPQVQGQAVELAAGAQHSSSQPSRATSNAPVRASSGRVTAAAASGSSSTGSATASGSAAGSNISSGGATGSSQTSPAMLHSNVHAQACSSTSVQQAIHESNSAVSSYSQDAIDDLFERTVALFASALGLDLGAVMTSFKTVATMPLIHPLSIQSSGENSGEGVTTATTSPESGPASEGHAISSSDLSLCFADFMPITSRFSTAALIPNDSRVFPTKPVYSTFAYSTGDMKGPTNASEAPSGDVPPNSSNRGSASMGASPTLTSASSTRTTSSTSLRPGSRSGAGASSTQTQTQTLTRANSVNPQAVALSSATNVATQPSSGVPAHLQQVPSWPSHVASLLRPSSLLAPPASYVDVSAGLVLDAHAVDGKLSPFEIAQTLQGSGAQAEFLSGLSPARALYLIRKLLAHTSTNPSALSLNLDDAPDLVVSPSLLLAVASASGASVPPMPSANAITMGSASTSSGTGIGAAVVSQQTTSTTGRTSIHRGSHAATSAAAAAAAAAMVAANTSAAQTPANPLAGLDETSASGLNALLSGGLLTCSPSQVCNVTDSVLSTQFLGSQDDLAEASAETLSSALASALGLDPQFINASAENAALAAVGSSAATAAVIFGSLVRLAEAAIIQPNAPGSSALSLLRRGNAARLAVRSLAELAKLPLSPLQHALLTCLQSKLIPSPSTLLALAMPPIPDTCRFYVFKFPPLAAFALPRADMLHQWCVLTQLSCIEGFGLIRQHAAAAAQTLVAWGLDHSSKALIDVEALYAAEAAARDAAVSIHQLQQQLQAHQRQLQAQHQLATQQQALTSATSTARTTVDSRGSSASGSRLGQSGLQQKQETLQAQQAQQQQIQQQLLAQQQAAQLQAQQQHARDLSRQILSPVNLNEVYPAVKGTSGSVRDTFLSLAQKPPLFAEAVGTGAVGLQIEQPVQVHSPDEATTPSAPPSASSTTALALAGATTVAAAGTSPMLGSVNQAGSTNAVEMGTPAWLERMGTYASLVALGPYAAFTGCTVEIDFALDGENFVNTGLKLTIEKIERRSALQTPQPQPRKSERVTKTGALAQGSGLGSGASMAAASATISSSGTASGTRSKLTL